jgi:ribonuclease R
VSILPNEKKIIEAVAIHFKGSFTASQLRGVLGVSKKDKRDFKHKLQELVRKNKLSFSTKKKYALLKAVESNGVEIDLSKIKSESKNEPSQSNYLKGRLIKQMEKWHVQDLDDESKIYPTIGQMDRPNRGDRVLYKVEKNRISSRSLNVARVIAKVGTTFSFQELSRDFLEKNSLEEKFSAKVTEEIQEIVNKGFNEGLRKDYSWLHTICIDPPGARDHDDAISLQKNPDGTWTLGVHIADVSHFVREGTALDKEALNRSFTQYLPWMAVGMLPDDLSSDLCSLKEGFIRLAFSCMILLNGEGQVLSYHFYKTKIKVHRFLTYENALVEMQAGDPQLVELAMMCRKLRANRELTGLLHLDLPETSVEFDAKGEPIAVRKKQYIESQSWIEECMLLANQCCARWIKEKKIPGIFRCHESPDDQDVSQLLTDDPSLLGDAKLSIDLIKAPSKSNLHPGKFKIYQAMVDHSRGNINHLRKILRSMAKARYNPDGKGHFALNWLDYAHFTSPIRRYADLWNHRRMTDFLEKKSSNQNYVEEALEVSTVISDQEIINQKIERQSQKLCSAWLVKDRIGEEFQGRISGLEYFGVFVEIPELSSEGLARFQDIEGDYYEYEPNRNRVIGKRSQRIFQVGDLVRIQILKVNALKGEVDLAIYNPKKS